MTSLYILMEARAVLGRRRPAPACRLYRHLLLHQHMTLSLCSTELYFPWCTSVPQILTRLFSLMLVCYQSTPSLLLCPVSLLSTDCLLFAIASTTTNRN
jgi:hypothetical protein